jgi:predicted porin
MKKSLFALAAVSAFAGAAQAQSSVSVYGIYDGGFSQKNTKETTTAGAQTNSQAGGFTGSESASSRIGFRGVEDLGKGLSANFNLELGFNAGTGEVTTATSSNTANTTGATQGSDTGVRTATIGLGDKRLGSIAIGRQLTGMHAILAGDVWGGNNMVGDMTYSDFASTSNGAGATANGRVNSVATRSSNMLTYTSPTVAGFSLRGDWGNTVATSSNYPGIQYAVAGAYATYTYGPITVKGGQVQAKSNEALTAANPYAASKTTINGANVMYRAQGLTVQYTIGNNKTEAISATATTLSSGVRAQKLSASYQVGAFTPFVQYGIGGTEATRTASAANTSTEDKALQVGVEYSLSKRSNLYAAYGTQERALKRNSAAKTEITDIAIGLRHTF